MPLTHDLLDRLDRQWRRLEPDWYPALRLGLSDAEMDQLTEPLGLTLPSELRTWWGWHNSADPRTDITPSLHLLSLEDAVATAQVERAVFHNDPEFLNEPLYDPEEQWPSSYLPVFGWGNDTINADCAIQEAASPLFYVSADDMRDRHELLSPSLGDLVHRTVEMYEAGYYTWQRRPDGSGDWESHGLARKISPYNLL